MNRGKKTTAHRDNWNEKSFYARITKILVPKNAKGDVCQSLTLWHPTLPGVHWKAIITGFIIFFINIFTKKIITKESEKNSMKF